MRSFKILAAFLSYPEEALKMAMPECLALLRSEKILSEEALNGLGEFESWFEQTETLDIQEVYVELFDRTPSLSLHLFEHVHGDSRERGQAMVELSEAYKEKGLQLIEHEIPDYLPVFLEYLSILPVSDARHDLGSVVSILAALRARLEKRNTPYQHVFSALIELADKVPDTGLVEQDLKKAPGTLPDMHEVDKTWEEQFAFATPDPNASSACPRASAMIQRIHETRKAGS